MNPTRLLPAALAAVVAGSAGYFWGKNSGDGAVNKTKSGIPVMASTGGKSAAPAAQEVFARVLDGGAVTAANGTAITMEVLSIPDPVRRMAVTSLLLESMTPENARAIHQGFVELTTKTGRKTDGEWALMLRKFGSVLGEAGYREAGEVIFNRALAMEGWASVDPEGAEKALKSDTSFHSDLNNAWLTGMCLKDPQKALHYALNGGSQALNAGSLMAQAIASSGIDGAQAALQAALDSSPPEAGASSDFHGLFNALVDNMFHRNATLGTPEVMLPWLEKQKDQPYVTGAVMERGASEVWRAGKPADAISFLERLNAERPEGEKVGAGLIFEEAFRDPEALAAVDDEVFQRALAMADRNPERLKTTAAVLSGKAPEKAAMVRALIPPPAAAPAPQ